MTPTQALTAPLDELRDWLAGEDGWTKQAAFVDHARGIVHPERWIKDGRSNPDGHPYPPTRDGAASAMPEGWKWKRVWDGGLNRGYWRAWIGWEHVEDVPDTGDEIRDRYLLAVMCRMAMKENAR